MNAMTTRARGFTLIELMIAMAIAVVVIAGVVVAANAQTRAYAAGARQRSAQSEARSALLYMEQRLQSAGYGMEPAFAFDFTTVPAICPPQLAPCPRDSQTNSDELVFYSRNPNYWIPAAGSFACGGTPCQFAGNAWQIGSTTAASVTISARAGDQFPMGQVVVMVCGGGNTYAYATVAQGVPPLAAPNPGLTLTLQAAIPNDPFNRPDLTVPLATNAACFQTGAARMFLVDRYRFHIRPVLIAGSLVPYLVLDRGIDTNGDNTIDVNDELVIAEGIENLQVAYVFGNPALPTETAGITGPIVYGTGGGTGSTGVANEITLAQFPGGAPATGQSVYDPSSFYSYPWGPPPAAQRLTDHQANIRAVRIALVGRSPGTDQEAAGDVFLPFNMTAEAPWVLAQRIGGRDGYQRALYESTVQLPNMTAGGLTYF